MSAICAVSGDTRLLELASEADTARLGACLAALLMPGDWLCLSGPLGAGKTALARTLIQARLGKTTQVPSPTYTLVNVFDALVPIWHADLYRLSDAEEVEELGLFDGADDRIVLLEWPERLGSLLPSRRIEVSLSFDGAGRRAEVKSIGGAVSLERVTI